MVRAGEALHRLQDQDTIHTAPRGERQSQHEHADFMVGVLLFYGALIEEAS